MRVAAQPEAIGTGFAGHELRRNTLMPAAAFAAFLVAWGNAASAVLGPTAVLPGGSIAYAAAGLALLGVSLLVARRLRLEPRDLGLRGSHARGGALGAAIGTAIAVAGIAALRAIAPLVVGESIAYEPMAFVTGPDLARHVAVLLPLGVILPEEVAFRGVLVAALARALDPRATIGVAAITFALWHASIVVATIGQTNLGGSAWTLLGIAGALVIVAGGGAAFAWLRLRTGTLATTVAAHWAFNAVVLLGLWPAR